MELLRLDPVTAEFFGEVLAAVDATSEPRLPLCEQGSQIDQVAAVQDLGCQIRLRENEGADTLCVHPLCSDLLVRSFNSIGACLRLATAASLQQIF